MTVRAVSAALLCLVPAALTASPWTTRPKGCALHVEPTRLEFSEEAKNLLKQDLDRPFSVPLTYENTQEDERFGVGLNWMQNAIDQWQSSFDVLDLEERMNKHPNYIARLPLGTKCNGAIDVHFMALFSQNPEAVPVVLLHGWPGSFMEFIDLFDVVKERYNAEDSPYHLIVPSLPGFTFSEGPLASIDWGSQNTAKVVDDLLVGLGFGDGYIAQGGDVGSFVAQTLSLTSESCLGIHLNFIPSVKPEDVPHPRNDTSLTEQDRKVLQLSEDYVLTKQAYALEQGTRPSTVGLTLSNNPVGLLAWLGEKFLAWTDPSNRPSTAEILDHVSLYHLTGTIARSLYFYRETSFSTSPPAIQPPYLEKPFGYSRFPWDNSGVPESWARAKGNMTFYRAHEGGGHFAALERPGELWDDVEAFIAGAFPNGL